LVKGTHKIRGHGLKIGERREKEPGAIAFWRWHRVFREGFGKVSMNELQAENDDLPGVVAELVKPVPLLAKGRGGASTRAIAASSSDGHRA